MHKMRINNEEMKNLVGGTIEFPKYTTQIMNLANQNAQGTRPKVVGQMSDLIQEFPGKTYEEWVTWYQDKMPNAIERATKKVSAMVENLKSAIHFIDEDLVRKWVADLVFTKTYIGLRFQEIILKKIASIKGQPYRFSTPEEESQGIDGYIGDKPVSIKPITYKTKTMYGEEIVGELIYYEKKSKGIEVTYDF